MITTIHIERSSKAKDVALRRRFKAVRRTPGGRIIPLGHASTRRRAFIIAREAAKPQTSPTAGGSYNPDGGYGWQNNEPIH